MATKQALIALAKERNIPLGDYDRKTKEEIAALLAGETLPAVTALTVLPSRFPGKCAVCNERYPPGTRIARAGTGRWAHEACANATSNTEDILNVLKTRATEATAEADALSQADDAAEPSLDDQLTAAAQQQQAPDDFVRAVREAVHGDGSHGMALVNGVALAVAAQVVAQVPQQSVADDAAVRRIVDKAVADLAPAAPREISITIQERPAVKIEEHTHPLFEKTLRLASAGLNVMLVGPAGCGKSTLAEQVAKALGADFGMLNCTAGASEAHLTGWLLPVGEHGRFEYVESEFVRLTERGNALFLLDEYDALDPNMSLALQSLLSAGRMALPHRTANPLVLKHPTTHYIAAANTFGTGADIQYAGRNLQDAAALDRWYIVEMGFDLELEARIVGRKAPRTRAWKAQEILDPAAIPALADWHEGLRASAKGMRRVIGTRMLQKGVAALRAGCSLPEVQADLLAGWTKDERSRAGVS